MLLSFACSAITVYYNQKFAFYMLPSRAWELLIGSFLAYTNWTPKTQKKKAGCILFGLFLMLFSIVFYGNNPYPGIWALLPCLGAALYIAGNTNYTFTNKFNLIHILTNNRIFIFIGVISYSLYLWHWIILLFYSYLKEFITETIYIILALFLTIILISAFSWKFIEQPIRKSSYFKNRKILWGSAAAAMLSIVVVSSVMRNPLHMQSLQYRNIITYTVPEYTEFYHYQNNKPIDFIVIGDSHAKSNTNLMEKLAVDYNCQGIYSKLWDVVNSFRQSKNAANEAKRIKQLILENNIKTVFIFMRLANEYTGKDIYYKVNCKLKCNR